MKLKTSKTIIFSAACLLAIGACAPTVTEHGNMLKEYQLKQVTPGTSTRSDVLRTLGSPTTQAPFDESLWYYIGQETEKHGVLDPKLTKEKVVVVKFTPDGVVDYIHELPRGSHMDIPIDKDKTKTMGNDFTVMQQFLGNIGKFNGAETEGKKDRH